MRMKRGFLMLAIALVVVAGVTVVQSGAEKRAEESEREVKEGEVPAAALAALKKLAGGASIREFAEEIEHGGTFYEGSWKGPDGDVDGLVTAAGDVVEIEERIATEKVPSAVRAALAGEAGSGTSARFERKTIYVYEAHFKKDGKNREVVWTPDGRSFRQEDGVEDAEGGEGEDD